jgi:hypothetical protein
MAHAALGELQPFAISEYHNHIAMDMLTFRASDRLNKSAPNRPPAFVMTRGGGSSTAITLLDRLRPSRKHSPTPDEQERRTCPKEPQ